MPKDFTPKQSAFIQEYLIDLNASQAAIRAGYSAKTSKELGCQLMANPAICDAIAAAMAERSKRTKITADRVLEEYARIGFADIRKAVNWGSSPDDVMDDYPVEMVPSDEVDDDTALAISEVSLTKGGVKVKMHDKSRALDSIARHLGMFNDKLSLTGPDGGPVRGILTLEEFYSNADAEPDAEPGA